tara:strand:+ start:2185 stop:2535 length:351 start_codon:yes stop_codon:yes gene_type:complete
VGDSEDTSPAFAQSLLSPTLTDAILGWTLEGQPHLEKLLSALHNDNIITEPLIQTFIFSVLGGYSHHFTSSLIDTQDIEQAHHHAMAAVMTNPNVSKMTESLLQQQITNAVKEVVE